MNIGLTTAFQVVSLPSLSLGNSTPILAICSPIASRTSNLPPVILVSLPNRLLPSNTVTICAIELLTSFTESLNIIDSGRPMFPSAPSRLLFVVLTFCFACSLACLIASSLPALVDIGAVLFAISSNVRIPSFISLV